MATANPPLAADFEDFGPIDDAYLEQCPPEERVMIEAARARAADGTSQTVPHSEILAHIEQQRLAAMKAG